jgi:hypothetical protein
MTTEYWPMDAAVLRDAFMSIDRLTSRDADFAAKNYQGVIAMNLDPESAFALLKALKARRVPARVVDEEHLPVPQNPVRVKRLSLSPKGLLAAGLLGNPTLIAWDHVIIASLVGLSKTRISPGAMSVDIGLDDNNSSRYSSPSRDAPTRSTQSVTWSLELFTDENIRYSLENGDVQLLDASLHGLGTREDRFENLARLINLNATSAVTNSRLHDLANSRLSALSVYANRVAYERETIWLLWFMQGCPGFDG